MTTTKNANLVMTPAKHAVALVKKSVLNVKTATSRKMEFVNLQNALTTAMCSTKASSLNVTVIVSVTEPEDAIPKALVKTVMIWLKDSQKSSPPTFVLLVTKPATPAEALTPRTVPHASPDSTSSTELACLATKHATAAQVPKTPIVSIVKTG